MVESNSMAKFIVRKEKWQKDGTWYVITAVSTDTKGKELDVTAFRKKSDADRLATVMNYNIRPIS